MAAAAAFALEAERDSAFAVIAAINARAGATANGLAAAKQVRQPRFAFFALLTTAEAMANADQRTESTNTFAEAEAAALRYDAPADLLSPLAQSQAKAGQIEQALKVVEVMQGKKSRSSSTTNGRPVDYNRGFALYEIAKAMAKVGRTSEALKLARQTEWDGEQIEHGVGVVAEGLAEAGRIDEALEAAKAQTNIGWRDDLLLDITRSRVAAGRFDDARKLIRGIDRDVERAQALLAIGSGLISKGAKADGRAAIVDALRLTTGMEYQNLALDILVDAGKLWPE
jgi:tetratricopeptide (TPR) repeat protein